MRHHRHRHLLRRTLSVFAVFLCLYACLRPWFLGGASPADRFVRALRIEEKLNPAEIFTDALSYAAGNRNGSFDIEYDGQTGTLSYAFDEEGIFRVLLQTEKDGVPEGTLVSVGKGLYSEYQIKNAKWKCTERRETEADMQELQKSLFVLLRGKQTDTTVLEAGLNALTDMDWSDYFVFPDLPSAVQSVFLLFSQPTFLSRLGFSYGHDGFLLTYRTLPQDPQYILQQVSAALACAYTSRTKTIVDIADMAGKVTKAIGWDAYKRLLGSEIYFTVHPLTGSLQELRISGKDTAIHLTVRNYGNTVIRTEADSISDN